MLYLMAIFENSATGTSVHTAEEMRVWFDANKKNIENFAKYYSENHTLKDVMKKQSGRSINAIDKATLKKYLQNISKNEKNLRDTARYLYYRSNILFRIINWYANMWDLRCRKVTPVYDLKKQPTPEKALKSYNATLTMLDKMNLQGNITEALINVYREDVYYAISFYDETGMFFYPLDPDECTIDSRYSTGDFGFAMDMSKWKSAQRQKIIEYIGSPLKEMYDEYVSSGVSYIHCPDKYAFCLKFRTDTWDIAIPPLLPTFIQMGGLEDLVDIQAEADDLSIYKLIYMPLKTISGSKNIDDFEIDPALAKRYFDALVSEGVLPDNVGAAMVPGDELKTIDFSRSVDTNINSVEQSSNQILQTAGGGAVINSNKITSTAAFKAWLKAETEFALSTLLPQVAGYTNRKLSYHVSNPCKVDYFEVSVYTKDELKEDLLKSCQYSFANRMAYNTLLGISERETLANLYLENEVLKLQDVMKYPLASSFTSSNNDYTDEVGQGAPTKDDDELSESGERNRNR